MEHLLVTEGLSREIASTVTSRVSRAPSIFTCTKTRKDGSSSRAHFVIRSLYCNAHVYVRIQEHIVHKDTCRGWPKDGYARKYASSIGAVFLSIVCCHICSLCIQALTHFHRSFVRFRVSLPSVVSAVLSFSYSSFPKISI